MSQESLNHAVESIRHTIKKFGFQKDHEYIGEPETFQPHPWVVQAVLEYKQWFEESQGHVVVTKNEDGQIVAVTRQDEEGKVLSVISQSDPCKNGYESAVKEACSLNHIEWDDTKPMETVARMVAAETEQALDPQVSPKARDLIEKGAKRWREVAIGMSAFLREYKPPLAHGEHAQALVAAVDKYTQMEEQVGGPVDLPGQGPNV